jgi:hypothetical protein
MRWLTLLVALLAMALLTLAPARAQDGFTPEQQAALDDIHAALNHLVGLDSYTAQIGQKMDQDITLTYLGRKVTVLQNIASDGTLQYEARPDSEYDNRHLDLTQTVVSTVISGEQTQESTVGPIRTQLIVIDDRVYLQMETPPELQGLIPAGWHDVTDGAEAFPGMALFDIQGMLKVGDVFSADYIDNLFTAVVAVEILESDTVGGRAVNHYQLVLDAPAALQSIGADTLEGMFDQEQTPFDVPGYIEVMFNDEDTRYVLDFAIYADDQTLYSYAERMTMDVLIPSDLIIDPTLQGAEMTLAQDVVQTLQFSGFNLPVSIQAPK